MATLKQVLHDEDNKIKKLKRQAGYQQKSRAKKARLLQEHKEVILYDSPDRPPFLTQYPNLIEHIHECIEFGAADKKRKKEIIKIILVNGGPDKNPRHMKNIYQYCRIFRAFDLDYLSIRTHTSGQSSYNPVERSMATLSQKLAGITLLINKYGSHLNSQGQIRVLTLELAGKRIRETIER
ncbi:hypothetical protein RhiirA5_402651 [Rhizophagus irregularis]|uniref:Uncharacterized protein n=1 Tax=Rhizophagus irregularis TaxID=588596 RepID=A0A2N0P4V3_9GLOM|nr:hypothetical protein RhiirA5_402651 [Rhizophagus irregularis]